MYGWRNWLGKHSSYVWNLVRACLKWLIWWERNSCTFEDVVKPIDHLKSLLMPDFVWLVLGLEFIECTSISDFLHFVRISIWFAWNCFKNYVFIIVNVAYFSLSIKFLLLTRKEKKKKKKNGFQEPGSSMDTF